MNVNLQAIAAMRAITISREYGSGGGEIAARLARRLGWQLIDHAIIEQTASELEVYVTEVEKHDEEEPLCIVLTSPRLFLCGPMGHLDRKTGTSRNRRPFLRRRSVSGQFAMSRSRR